MTARKLLLLTPLDQLLVTNMSTRPYYKYRFTDSYNLGMITWVHRL